MPRQRRYESLFISESQAARDSSTASCKAAVLCDHGKLLLTSQPRAGSCDGRNSSPSLSPYPGLSESSCLGQWPRPHCVAVPGYVTTRSTWPEPRPALAGGPALPAAMRGHHDRSGSLSHVTTASPCPMQARVSESRVASRRSYHSVS